MPSTHSPTQPPLAVVGLSALFPKAANAEEFWSNIRRGVDAITEIPDTHWNPDDYFDSNPKTPDMTYARRGGFLSPFTADVNTAASAAIANGGAGASFTYANGANKGQAYNGLVANIVLFDSQLKDFNNFTNDLKLDHSFDVGSGATVTATGGYYKSSQNIVMDWDWNSYFEQVGGSNAALLNLTNGAVPGGNAPGTAAPGLGSIQNKPSIKACNPKGLQAMSSGGMLVVMMDGSVRTVSTSINRETARKAHRCRQQRTQLVAEPTHVVVG